MTPKTSSRRVRGNGGGSIGKWNPKRKCYPVAVTVAGTGRRLTGRAPTKRAAEQLLAKLQRQAAEQAPPAALLAGARTDVPSVGEWLTYWRTVHLAARKGVHGTGVSANHKRRAEWACDAITEALGSRKLHQLTQRDVESFLAARAAGVGVKRKRNGRGWSASSCTTVRNVLADALDEAIRQEDCGIWRNVARKAQGFAEAAAAEQRFAVNRETSSKLYRAARDSDELAGPVIALLITTGMRQTEARELRWSEIDFVAGTLRVIKAKTPTGKRIIRLGEAALDVLREQRRAVPSDCDVVFPGLRAECVSAYAVIDALARLCHQLTVYVGDELRVLHPHELRHTFTSLMLQDRVPVDLVAAMIGDHVETVQRVYAHLLDETVGDAAVQSVDSIFGGAA